MLAALRPAFRPLARASSAAALPLQRATFATSLRALEIKKRYAESHEWVSFDDKTNIGTIGVSRYAANNLGDVVFIELATKGTEVSKGDNVGAIESVKAASELYTPVTGIVEEVNESLNDSPETVNSEPEGEGWIVKLKLTNPAEIDSLLSEEAYAKMCEGESH